MSLAQKVCTVPLEFRRYPLPDYSHRVGQLACDSHSYICNRTHDDFAETVDVRAGR
jgi:hypothetical protein